jgi:HD superfamily phosphohydrolase
VGDGGGGGHDAYARRVKVFNDDVHRHVALSLVSVAVIDTPQFQRLRNLRQLGGVYEVFPAASHARFEHSVGTGHLARTFIAALAENQPELRVTVQERLCVELAGLCHDLGHGIMSHLYDRKFVPAVAAAAGQPVTWSHEHASVAMLQHVVDTYPHVRDAFDSAGMTYAGEGSHLQLVQELILGARDEAPPGWEWHGAPRGKEFLFEVVANKRTSVDVDKLDYFARDCLHLNLGVMFDAARLMRFARVVHVDGTGVTAIAFAAKEDWNVRQLFTARFSLHKRAYQHRVARIVETMYTEALVLADPFIRVDGAGGRTYRMSTCMHDPVAYTRCSDYLLNVIEHSPEPQLAAAQEVLRRIRTRRLYRFVAEFMLTDDARRVIAATAPPPPAARFTPSTPPLPPRAAPTVNSGGGSGPPSRTLVSVRSGDRLPAAPSAYTTFHEAEALHPIVQRTSSSQSLSDGDGGDGGGGGGRSGSRSGGGGGSGSGISGDRPTSDKGTPLRPPIPSIAVPADGLPGGEAGGVGNDRGGARSHSVVLAFSEPGAAAPPAAARHRLVRAGTGTSVAPNALVAPIPASAAGPSTGRSDGLGVDEPTASLVGGKRGRGLMSGGGGRGGPASDGDEDDDSGDEAFPAAHLPSGTARGHPSSARLRRATELTFGSGERGAGASTPPPRHRQTRVHGAAAGAAARTLTDREVEAAIAGSLHAAAIRSGAAFDPDALDQPGAAVLLRMPIHSTHTLPCSQLHLASRPRCACRPPPPRRPPPRCRRCGAATWWWRL